MGLDGASSDNKTLPSRALCLLKIAVIPFLFLTVSCELTFFCGCFYKAGRSESLVNTLTLIN